MDRKPNQGLSVAEIDAFNRDGYIIIPDALPPTTIDCLLSETHSLLDNFSLESHPMTTFSTGQKGEHTGDEYFLTSGDKIRFFFEEDAFDEQSRLTKPKALAINKIGHGLHMLSRPFADLLRNNPSSRLSPSAIATSLGFRDPRCLQSMIICKQPEIGGAVPPHQDSTFLFTNPPSAVGFWYALEDATLQNGCLSFLPGSHKWAPITRRLVRKPGNSGTEMVLNEGARFPDGEGYHELPSGEMESCYVPGEVKAGTLVLIHGNLLHKSERNLSQRSRTIYTFHVIEGDGAAYDKRNWLQPSDGGFSRLTSGEI